jgi:hypothetical protein
VSAHNKKLSFDLLTGQDIPKPAKNFTPIDLTYEKSGAGG